MFWYSNRYTETDCRKGIFLYYFMERSCKSRWSVHSWIPASIVSTATTTTASTSSAAGAASSEAVYKLLWRVSGIDAYNQQITSCQVCWNNMREVRVEMNLESVGHGDSGRTGTIATRISWHGEASSIDASSIHVSADRIATSLSVCTLLQILNAHHACRSHTLLGSGTWWKPHPHLVRIFYLQVDRGQQTCSRYTYYTRI